MGLVVITHNFIISKKLNVPFSPICYHPQTSTVGDIRTTANSFFAVDVPTTLSAYRCRHLRKLSAAQLPPMTIRKLTNCLHPLGSEFFGEVYRS